MIIDHLAIYHFVGGASTVIGGSLDSFGKAVEGYDRGVTARGYYSSVASLVLQNGLSLLGQDGQPIETQTTLSSVPLASKVVSRGVKA